MAPGFFLRFALIVCLTVVGPPAVSFTSTVTLASTFLRFFSALRTAFLDFFESLSLSVVAAFAERFADAGLRLSTLLAPGTFKDPVAWAPPASLEVTVMFTLPCLTKS